MMNDLVSTRTTLAEHHGTAHSAEQLGGQQIIVLGLVVGRRAAVLFDFCLHTVEQLLVHDGDCCQMSVFVAIIPLNVLNAMVFRKKMRVTNSAFRLENEKMSAKLTTMLQMLTLTKAHGLETVETVEMQHRIDSVKRAGLKLDKTNAYFGSISGLSGSSSV